MSKLVPIPSSSRTSRTLDQWIKQPGANEYLPITSHAPRVGLHDVQAIQHIRTYLWDLADYYVQISASWRDIWIAPKNQI